MIRGLKFEKGKIIIDRYEEFMAGTTPYQFIFTDLTAAIYFLQFKLGGDAEQYYRSIWQELKKKAQYIIYSGTSAIDFVTMDFSNDLGEGK